jgi:hypothetical protein
LKGIRWCETSKSCISEVGTMKRKNYYSGSRTRELFNGVVEALEDVIIIEEEIYLN